jgi:PKD repeat protein
VLGGTRTTHGMWVVLMLVATCSLALSASAGGDGTAPGGFLSENEAGLDAAAASAAAAATLPSGFQESIVFSGLTLPTAVRFASDGRVFVAEKSGLIQVFDSLSDTSPTTFADLRSEVDDYWDRGLLGLALDPSFPASPYVYVLYAYDAPIGGVAPVWNDACPTPPGPTTDGCVVSGRLARLTASGNSMTGSEQVLLNDWCQQFPSHSVGGLHFGADGALYVSGGDGASFINVDYGQYGGSAGSGVEFSNTVEGIANGTAISTTTGGGDDWTYVDANNNTITSDNAHAWHGTQAIKIAMNAVPSGIARVGTLFPQTVDIFGQVGLYRTANPKSGQLQVVVEFETPGVGLRGFVSINDTGHINVYDSAVTHSATMGTAIALNAWNRIEFHYHGDTETGSIEARLYSGDSTTPVDSVVTTANANTGPGATAVMFGQSYPIDGGASFWIDDPQVSSTGDSTPKNPCGDPPAGVGGSESPPSAEGGALRSQSLHRASGPALLNGTVLRVDPGTGNALPTNPLASSGDPNARRIVAEGLRNPFRFTIRPGTNDLWIGDVGWGTWEEINRQSTPTAGVANFGWPCYEGDAAQPGYQSAGLDVCNRVYAAGAVAPYYAYIQGGSVVSGDGCTTGSSSISGMAFYDGGTYPASYDGALFFADHARNCIWVMYPGPDGLPSAANRAVFVNAAAGPVDLQIGPGGDLFYVGFDDGTIRRIRYFAGNQPPIAQATASPTSGPAPLTVSFDGSGSADPDPGDTISYAWDLNGDGVYGDSTAQKPTHTYATPGTYSVRLRVTDSHGANGTSAAITISANNTPPVPVIDSPSSSLTWKVGDSIAFSGHASDAQDGTEPASRLTWTIILHHCPTNCHTHPIQTISGVASGSLSAPDHEYPSHLELQLTATDATGLSASASVNLNPQTVGLTFQSSPSGAQLTVGTFSGTAPFTRTVIVNSMNSLSAPNQSIGGSPYVFSSWSDGGAQTHTIRAPAAPATYTATLNKASSNQPPVSTATATPTSGPIPLTVKFDGSGSSDPDGDPITYSWDLNGDGVLGDSTLINPSYIYTKPGKVTVRLVVSDGRGGSSSATVDVQPRKK